MKTNPYDAAFIRTTGSIATPTDGLTKLEFFAGLAMQGFTASTEGSYSSKNIAEASVRMAKVLIDELNKEGNDDKR